MEPAPPEILPSGAANPVELNPPPFKSTRLGGVTVLPPYSAAPFRVKRADGTLAEDAYNVFAAAPGQLLRRPTLAALAREPRFGRVVQTSSAAQAEAVAEVTVNEIGLDCRDGRKAAVSVGVNVIKGREVVLAGEASAVADAADGDYTAAFSKAYGDALRACFGNLK